MVGVKATMTPRGEMARGRIQEGEAGKTVRNKDPTTPQPVLARADADRRTLQTGTGWQGLGVKRGVLCVGWAVPSITFFNRGGPQVWWENAVCAEVEEANPVGGYWPGVLD